MNNTYPAIIDRLQGGPQGPNNGGKGNSEHASFESDDIFHIIAENTSDFILHFQHKPVSRVAYVSPSFVRVTGYSSEEYYADPKLAKKFIHPDDHKLLNDLLNPDNTHGHEPLVMRCVHKDGRIIWIEATKTVIRDESGEATDVYYIARDITERKTAEEALRQSEEFTHNLLENAPNPIISINTDTSIRYVNPAFEQLTGFTLAEIAGMKIPHPWWPEEDREEITASIKKFMTIGSGRLERRFQKKNGEVFWIEMKMVKIMHNGILKYHLANWVDITERKLAEEKQQAIIKTALDGFWICDLKGKFLDVNDSYCKTTGYTREELLEMSIKDIEAVESHAQTAQHIKKIVEQGSDRFETQHRRKDGKIINIEISVNYLNIGEGQMFVFVRNITERKQAEEALWESQRFNTSLLENATHATVVINPDTSIRYVNPAWERINGWTLAEVVGTKAPYPWWPEEYKQEFNDRFNEAMKQGSGKGEVIAQKKNGELYWIDMNWTSVTNNGELLYLLINSIDITERMKAQEALRFSEEKFRNLFEHAKDAVILADTQTGIIVDVNTAGCSLLGLPKEKIIGMHQSNIHPPETVEKGKQLFQDHIEKGVALAEDILIQRADGVKVPVDISASVVKLADKSIIQGVFRDITERKQAEEALANEAIRRRILIEQSRDGIVILDENGKVYETNRRFAEMLGYSVEEVLQLNVWDWEYQYPHEQVVEMIRTVDENGDHFETRHRRKDGSVYDVEISTNGANFVGQKLVFCVCRDITERKQMEKALRESEEKFSKAFHASPSSISISRLADGKFIEVNDGFLRDKEYTREEVIGHTSTELNIWVEPGAREKVVQTLKSGGRVHNELSQFRTKKGYIRTGLLSAELINIGNEPCMITMNNDITQQKLAEERLRLLSSVTQQVSDSTIVTDRNFKITYMNKAAQDLLGYSAEEALGKGLELFNAGPVPKEVIRNISQTVASGKVWSATVPKKRKDGKIITCESRMSPLYDEKGQVSSFIDVQRDITEQKEMEAKLQEHKQLIESILTAMPEGVLVTDGNGRIILANEAFYQIFHRRKQATVNKLLGETINIDQLVNLYEAVKRGEVNDNTLEFRYRVKDLEKIISSVIVKMDGECTLLTFIDISRDREEEEKLYLTDRLASIGEMAAGLAHELNNPLTGILALSQLLVDSDIPPEHKEDLQCIHSEAKRAASIVKNVLLFARNNTYENGQASVNEAVRDVLRLREHEEKVSNIKVVTNLEDTLPDINIDKYQLQQVFLNIILNAEAAIKETSRPGILTVKTERVNNHINIMFKDNGCGIKKHIMPRIFDPFFTTKEIGKGTGLGLSICYSIVVKHGGKISVNSQVNKGSTFTIRIPVVT